MPLRNLVMITLISLISLACYSVASKNRYANLFAEAIEVIDREGLREIPRRKLFDNAMKGMMSDLDEHSMYISGEMFRAFEEDMKQQFGGVGMYVDNDPKSGRLTVLAPIPNTPAFEAGVQAGDIITEIEGQDTQGMERIDAIKLMRGIQGTSVNIKLERNGKMMERDVVRASIPVPSLHGDWRNPDGTWNYRLKEHPKIGYFRLLQFGSKSTEEFATALDEVGEEVDAMILDLRNNSGGLLDAAISVCDTFLNDRLPIVSTRGRGRVLVGEHFSTSQVGFAVDKPLVILVNRNSASASEIVAACLQDHGRAVIIGEQTWGKGTVQNVIPVERGKSALKLTTASYWRPSGRNIDRFDEESQQTGQWGVQPNSGLKIEYSEEQIFEEARERNQRDLQGLILEPSQDPSTEQKSAEEESYIDRAIRKAIEVIDARLSNRIAA